MKECDVHRKLLEEMSNNDEPGSDGEVHSDGGEEVTDSVLQYF